MIRPVLKMGEELLLGKAMPVKSFGTPELRKLVADMWDTMDTEGGIWHRRTAGGRLASGHLLRYEGERGGFGRTLGSENRARQSCG